MLFIRPCCHDEDRQAARMKAPKHGISDGSQWPVRYSNSAPITLIARTNVAYGSDATLKKCDINCVIITQLIISSRRQRDQAVRIPSEMGSEPKNCQLGESPPPRNKAVSPQPITCFLTLFRREEMGSASGRTNWKHLWSKLDEIHIALDDEDCQTVRTGDA